jgi:hypothetical protein
MTGVTQERRRRVTGPGSRLWCMTQMRKHPRFRRCAAAVLSAAMVGIGGVGLLTPETAQAAGVVLDRHPSYGTSTMKVPPVRERDEDA